MKEIDTNAESTHASQDDSIFGDTSRREFLKKSAYAAAGAVTLGLTTGSATAKESAAAGKATAGGVNLISPTFETSPTYLATYEASDRAKKIVQDAIFVDTLFSAVYPLQWKDDNQFEPVMKECKASGMNILGICPSGDSAGSDPKDVFGAARFYYKKIYASPDKYMLVRSTDDIRKAVKEGKLGIYLTHQGTNQFQGDVDNVALMKGMGYGYCLLVYNNKNAVGGGCADKEDHGLTDYGRKLIQAYNRYGMVVDVNHTGNRTALDACEASAKPIIASHSGAKGVFNSFRNLSDELIVAIAKTGGVCSMFGTGAYIDPTNPKVVSPEIIFKHIDYMVQLHGNVDHVGYGSDWIPDMNGTMKLVAAKADTYPDMGMPTGTTKKAIEMYAPTANPARIMPAIVDLMLKAGYKEKDIHKFLGGNIIRVFDACWNGADVEITEKPNFAKDWR
jgi:membrane dipeptidase